MKYRHEIKQEIGPAEAAALRQRLLAVAKPDAYAKNGSYEIRSLYFDDPSDRALREKLYGVSRREKFRLRSYDRDFSLIFLEKKSKLGGLCSKERCRLTRGEAERVLACDAEYMSSSGNALVRELGRKTETQLLRPKTLVDYRREPFVYPAGNVRITIDSDIRTGLCCTDFFDPDCVTVPAGDAKLILEVKWDEFLPDVIRDVVQLGSVRSSAFSKYAACRIYD